MERFGVLKAIGAPGSLGFLIFFGAIGALMLRFQRTRKFGQWFLRLLAVGYVAMSVPAVAHVIAGVSPATPHEEFSAYAALDDIFVIDGDNYKARAKTAVQLTSTNRPQRVWIVGGKDLKDALLANGLPDELWEFGKGSAPTTYDQLIWVRNVVEKYKSRRAAVVVSRLQGERVRGLVRRAHFDVIVVSSPVDREPSSTGILRWIPSFSALALSREALYERAALFYYRRNGWI